MAAVRGREAPAVGGMRYRLGGGLSGRPLGHDGRRPPAHERGGAPAPHGVCPKWRHEGSSRYVECPLNVMGASVTELLDRRRREREQSGS